MTPLYQSPLLTTVPGLTHGFFGAEGGVSQGPFSSLNCDPHKGDKPENVLENRRRVMTYLGFSQSPLLTLRQIHETRIKMVTTPWELQSSLVADGMVTCIPHLALGILTADCGPVLFVDTQKRVIGACHAGWRGAFAGILEETIKAMEALGSQRANIVASLGPTIAQESYEVDALFYQKFLKEEASMSAFFQNARKENHFLFNLPGFIQKKLEALHLKNVHILGKNTFTGPFFSRRKIVKNKQTTHGCGVSVIMLS